MNISVSAFIGCLFAACSLGCILGVVVASLLRAASSGDETYENLHTRDNEK